MLAVSLVASSRVAGSFESALRMASRTYGARRKEAEHQKLFGSLLTWMGMGGTRALISCASRHLMIVMYNGALMLSRSKRDALLAMTVEATCHDWIRQANLLVA